MDQHARIRQLHRDGLTVGQIAAQLHHSSKTILKVLAGPAPDPLAPAATRAAPVFDPVRGIVDAILAADETAPRKQRHTAQQIFRRLVADHGYAGSYAPVQRYLKGRRLDRRETFVPLDHRPGSRAEADCGHIAVDFPGGRRSVPVRIVTWSDSNAPFALALPTERTEAILHGLVEAFGFFGCVPAEVWWDNPTTVAVHVLAGRERTVHPRYAALAAHDPFTPKFCLPVTPREKPRVENRVFDLQRQWATPVPQVVDLAALNTHLRPCCVAARGRTCGGNPETVQVRFDRERAAAAPVPARPFDPCVFHPAMVDKYQTARFDHNAYSVPRRWAFRPVTVTGYVDRVAVVADGQVIATHPRSYGRGDKILDPLHFLVVLERKPAALDHAPVYRDGQLPPALPALRRALEERVGPSAGAKPYIRVLQLLARHPMGRVEQAVASGLAAGAPDAARIIATAERLAEADRGTSAETMTRPAATAALPDLSRFDHLLTRSSRGDETDDRRERPAGDGQPQDAQTSGPAGRVGPAGP
ncbi:Mobile element protein [Fimbriiglobus ruber]|uniref:Mobile element protein n=1 Tax=Fimbriiglobus ruber TaxID=1908690 RepID=A0A225DIA5_9BACT|nr:Mobile element protein [Fimbriiglobus ruber]